MRFIAYYIRCIRLVILKIDLIPFFCVACRDVALVSFISWILIMAIWRPIKKISIVGKDQPRRTGNTHALNANIEIYRPKKFATPC